MTATGETNEDVGLRDKAANSTHGAGRVMAGAWRRTTLDQLGRIVTGKTPPSSHSNAFGGAIPFVTPSDMDGRRTIRHTARNLTESGAASVRGSRVPANAVMVSCIGSDMGKAAIAGSECVTNQQINSIVIETDDSPLYVYYDLSTRKAEIRGAASGSAQPILNKSAFGRFEIELPPPDEQRAIAHILGSLDDKIELNRRKNETLEAIAQAIFKSWFVDFDPVRAKASGEAPDSICRRLGLTPDLLTLFPDRLVDSELGEIPEGWRVGDFRDCCDRIESGGTPSRSVAEYWNGVIPWLTSGEVRDVIILNTKEKITVAGLNESSAKLWPIGTTVVAMYGATAGQVCLLAEKMTANQACCALIPKPEFLSLVFLTARGSIAQLSDKASGSAQQNLNKSLVANHQLILPPQNVAYVFEQATSCLIAKWISNQREGFTLAVVRDALLPKLLSGELRVSEADSNIEACA